MKVCQGYIPWKKHLDSVLFSANIMTMPKLPYKSEEEKKSSRFQMRVTVDELERMTAAAKTAGKPLSRWARDILLAAAPPYPGLD